MTDPTARLISEYQRDLSALVHSKGYRDLEFYMLYGRYTRKAMDLAGLKDYTYTAPDFPQIRAAVAACLATKNVDPDALADLALWGRMAIKTIAGFRAKLWAAVKRLWDGGSDANFIAGFARSIDAQLTEAWNEGAASVGVEPDEMTPDDLAILEAIINNENQFILRLAGEIQGDRDGGMKEETFTSKYTARVNLWANRYNEVVNRARITFGEKKRFMWKEGGTEKKCGFCKALNGIVAFGYEWDEARCHPQMPPNAALTGTYNGEPGCSGWGCECGLEPTTKRRTPRALDKITQIVLSGKL